MGITIKGFAVKILQRTTRICFPRVVLGLETFLCRRSDIRLLRNPYWNWNRIYYIQLGLFVTIKHCLLLNFVLSSVEIIILTRLKTMQLQWDKAESFTFVQILNACVGFPQASPLCIYSFNSLTTIIKYIKRKLFS